MKIDILKALSFIKGKDYDTGGFVLRQLKLKLSNIDWNSAVKRFFNGGKKFDGENQSEFGLDVKPVLLYDPQRYPELLQELESNDHRNYVDLVALDLGGYENLDTTLLYEKMLNGWKVDDLGNTIIDDRKFSTGPLYFQDLGDDSLGLLVPTIYSLDNQYAIDFSRPLNDYGLYRTWKISKDENGNTVFGDPINQYVDLTSDQDTNSKINDNLYKNHVYRTSYDKDAISRGIGKVFDGMGASFNAGVKVGGKMMFMDDDEIQSALENLGKLFMTFMPSNIVGGVLNTGLEIKNGNFNFDTFSRSFNLWNDEHDLVNRGLGTGLVSKDLDSLNNVMDFASMLYGTTKMGGSRIEIPEKLKLVAREKLFLAGFLSLREFYEFSLKSPENYEIAKKIMWNSLVAIDNVTKAAVKTVNFVLNPTVQKTAKSSAAAASMAFLGSKMYQLYLDSEDTSKSKLERDAAKYAMYIGLVGIGKQMRRERFYGLEEDKFEYTDKEARIQLGLDYLSNRTENYFVALDLLKKGADPLKVKMATGWELGKNGELMHEERDPKVSSNAFDIIKNAGDNLTYLTFTVKLFFGNDPVAIMLSNMYPEFNSLRIRFDNNPGSNALYDPDNNIIYINVNTRNSSGLINEEVAHELLHFVLDLEGWEGGTNRDIAKPNEALKNINNLINQIYSDYDKQAAIVDEAGDKFANGEISRELYYNEMLKLDDMDPKNNPDKKALLDKLLEQRKQEQYNSYRLATGENVASGVQKRVDLTDLERIGSLLSDYEPYHREEQINNGSLKVKAFDLDDYMIGNSRKSKMKEDLHNIYQLLPSTNMAEDLFINFYSALIEELGEKSKPTTYKSDGTVKKPGGDRRLENNVLGWISLGANFNEGSIYTIQKALEVAKKYKLTDLTIQLFKTPYDLLDTYGEKVKLKPLDPHKEPTFHFLYKLRDGIEVFQVDDTREGLQAVRKTIDTHIGPEHSPWCLAAVEKEGVGYKKTPWEWWSETYTNGPKKIAFRNGKLIAFNASNETKVNLWYNLHDESKRGILVVDKKGNKQYHYEITEDNQKHLVSINKGLMCNPGINILYDVDTEEPSIILFVENNEKKTAILIVPMFNSVKNSAKSYYNGYDNAALKILFGHIGKILGVGMYGMSKNTFIRGNDAYIYTKDPGVKYEDLFNHDLIYEVLANYIYDPSNDKCYKRELTKSFNRFDFEKDKDEDEQNDTLLIVQDIAALWNRGFNLDKGVSLKQKPKKQYEYVEVTDKQKIKEIKDIVDLVNLKYQISLKKLPNIIDEINNIHVRGDFEKPDIESTIFKNDLEIVDNTLKFIQDSILYWRGDKLKNDLLKDGWTEDEYNLLLKEIDRTIGIINPVQVQGVSDGFEPYGRHHKEMTKDGLVSHYITVNRDRLPDIQRLLELIYHELGGHGITASIRPDNPNPKVIEQFPMMYRLMLRNSDFTKDLLLKPEWRYVKEVSDYIDKYGIQDLILKWRSEGKSDKQIGYMYENVLLSKISYYKNKVKGYIDEPLEASTRLRVLKMMDLFNPGNKTLNELQMENIFTAGSVLKVKNKIFSILPYLLIAGALSSATDDDKDKKSDGGLININSIDWNNAVKQYFNNK